MESFKLNIHGKQTLLPKLISTLIFIGWGCMAMLIIVQKTTFKLPSSIIPFLIIIFFLGFAATILGVFQGLFETKLLWRIIGQIKFNKASITINNNNYPIEQIKKVYLKIFNTKGVSDGAGIISHGGQNEIEITTDLIVEKQKFILENKQQRH